MRLILARRVLAADGLGVRDGHFLLPMEQRRESIEENLPTRRHIWCSTIDGGGTWGLGRFAQVGCFHTHLIDLSLYLFAGRRRVVGTWIRSSVSSGKVGVGDPERVVFLIVGCEAIVIGV